MSSTPSNTNRSWFTQLFEMSPDPSWIIDGNRFVECNEAAVRTLGYTNRAEFLNTHPSKLSPPSQPDGEGSYAKAEHMMAIAKDQGLHRFEWLHTKADGTNLVAEVTLSAIELRGRQVLYCVWRDITGRKQSEAALRESESRFRLTFELAASGIANVALDGRFVRVNRSLCAILGYSEQELIGRTVKELSHPEDRDKTDVARARVQLGELESTRFEKRYFRKDGATVWVDLTIALVRDAQGKPLYEIAVFDDITERTQAEQALRDSAEKLRVFADNVPAMTAAFDQNLRLLFVNKRYADFFGHGATDILGKHLREIVGERTYSDIKCHYVEVLQGHPVTFQRARKRQNGEIRYLEIKLMPNIGEHGKVLGCFAVVIDITEHKLVEERIQRVAHYDSLTGLPNRILFNDRLTQAISHAKRDSRQFALLYLDLNKFKPVNDSLGHSAGDELLHAVAARIRCQMRESDTVARVGGDEFVVILLDVAGPDEVEIVARKIIATVETPFQLGAQKQNVDIGTSIGIALYPAHARDADALIKAADAAMYSAKQMPGSSFRFAGLKPIAA